MSSSARGPRCRWVGTPPARSSRLARGDVGANGRKDTTHARGRCDPRLPQAGGRERHLRAAGRTGDPALRRALRRSGHPDLPGAPRAGCRPHGRRVREGHRAGRCLHGHLGTRRDQPRDPDRRRLHGLGAPGRDHRPGRLHAGGHRRLPGGGHRRHHPADREALLPGEGRRRPAAGARRGPLPGPVGAARAGAGGRLRGPVGARGRGPRRPRAGDARLPAPDRGGPPAPG